MMCGLYVLAQAAGPVDSNTIGVSVTSLIGSLGAAGAAVAVTYYFLGFLRTEGEKQTRVFGEFREYHAESQRKFQDQLERLTDRHEQLQHAFQEQISRLIDGQNSLLRDAILAMKSVEKNLENSTQTIHEMEKIITALQFSVNGIDAVIRRMTEDRDGPEEIFPAFFGRGERIVSRVERAPLLLALAGILLFLSVVAYLLSDMEGNLRNQEATQAAREALRVQKELAFEDRLIYRAETERISKEHVGLRSQQDAIMKSLKRIEDSLRADGLLHCGR